MLNPAVAVSTYSNSSVPLTTSSTEIDDDDADDCVELAVILVASLGMTVTIRSLVS